MTDKLLKQIIVRGFTIDLFAVTEDLVEGRLDDTPVCLFNIKLIDFDVFLNNTLVRIIQRNIVKIKKDEWSEAEMIEFILDEETREEQLKYGFIEPDDYYRFNTGHSSYVVLINSDGTYGPLYKFCSNYKDLK